MANFKNEFTGSNTFKDAGAEALVGSITVRKGQGNFLSIGKGSKFKGSVDITGNNNRIIIGENCHYRGDILVKGNNQTVSFGDESTTVNVYLLCQENCDVIIGKWCMFSREIEIRTTDAHSVIDRATGRRLNTPASIVVGDHVWVGVGAIISKGAVIPSDSIVGAMSFVNGKFDEEGVIIAGAPGKIVKRGITWSRSRRAKFSKEEMDHWKS